MIDIPKLLDDEEAAKFYSESIDAKPTLRVKILLDSVHLRPPKLSRAQVKNDSVLANLSILQIANSRLLKNASTQE